MKKVVPRVPSLNIRTSLEFYCQKLGFGGQWQFNENYGGVGVPFELNFCFYDDPAFPQNYVIRFEVPDIQEHYQLCQHRIMHPHGSDEIRP